MCIFRQIAWTAVAKTFLHNIFLEHEPYSTKVPESHKHYHIECVKIIDSFLNASSLVMPTPGGGQSSLGDPAPWWGIGKGIEHSKPRGMGDCLLVWCVAVNKSGVIFWNPPMWGIFKLRISGAPGVGNIFIPGCHLYKSTMDPQKGKQTLGGTTLTVTRLRGNKWTGVVWVVSHMRRSQIRISITREINPLSNIS